MLQDHTNCEIQILIFGWKMFSENKSKRFLTVKDSRDWQHFTNQLTLATGPELMHLQWNVSLKSLLIKQRLSQYLQRIQFFWAKKRVATDVLQNDRNKWANSNSIFSIFHMFSTIFLKIFIVADSSHADSVALWARCQHILQQDRSNFTKKIDIKKKLQRNRHTSFTTDLRYCSFRL